MRKRKRGILLLLLAGIFISIQTKAQTTFRKDLERAVALGSNQPDSAFLIMRNIHTKALEEKDNTLAGLALQQMGQICYRLGHYSQALDFHLQASSLFTEAGKPDLLAANFNDIGTLYYYNKQIPLARQQFNQALSIFRQQNNIGGIGATYGNIGHLYEKHQRYDSAFYFQNLALQQFSSLKNKTGLGDIYENIGSIYEDLEKYDSAYRYFSLAYDQYQGENDPLKIIEILNNQGDVLRKTGKYLASINETRQAIALALQSNEPYQLNGAYRDMSKAWHLLNRDDSAYYYLELSRKALLDIYSGDNNKQVAFLQVLNDIGKKNAEIEKLKISHKNNVALAISAIVVTVLLILISALIISRQRLKIKNERLLSEQHRDMYAARSELMEVDLKNKQLQEEALRRDLEMKAKELSTHTLHIIQKNQLLEELRNKLELMVKEEKRDQKKQLNQLMQQIDQNFNHDQYWDDFRNIFEQLHESFFEKVRRYCEDLTANDLRLIALIKMNMNSMDMATLLGISPDSLRVNRYRLRKKLNLEQGHNLSSFIQGL